jgi:hypothetical protein
MARMVFAMVWFSFLASPKCDAQVQVPEKYKALYEQYRSGLEKYIAYLDKNAGGGKKAVCFGAELLAANSNRGEELLQPRALRAVELTLDRFKELGIQGATVAIGYPVLTDDLERSKDYLEFYRKVAEQVRARKMRLCVKLHVLFSGTVFSAVKVDFTSLTIEKFSESKRLMAERAISELSPDYLTLGGEPDTEAKLTGLKELNTPETYAGMVRFILRDLHKGRTLVGVGQGTWVTPDFAKAYAQTDVDFINIHVYPFGKRVLDVLNQIISTAHEKGKRLIMDECWLYKVSGGDALGVGESANIYRRDCYSFWEPADKLFLEAMAKLAVRNNIEYVSPFWTHCCFAHLKYDTLDESLPYAAINRKFVQAVSESMQSDEFSETGRFYSELIRKYGIGE